MSVPLLVLWAAGLVLLPGRRFAELVLPADSRRHRIETWSFAFAFGLGWLCLLAISLRFLNALRLPWVGLATLALVAVLGLRGKKLEGTEERPRPPGAFFWLPFLGVICGIGLGLLPHVPHAFGADTYFWTEAAVRLAAGGPIDGRAFWEVYPAITGSPTGYGYLLATAALVTPEIGAGEAIVFFALLWTAFAFASAYSLGEHLAGRGWAAVGALVYVGSYWTLYFLVTSVSRQGVGFALAPLFFLLVARMGAAVVRAIPFYALLGTAFALHALTAFFLLSSFPAVFLVEWIRGRGARPNLFGMIASLALSAVPLAVLGRFLGDLTGIVPLSDAPFKYRLEPFDPAELVRTLGGLTIAVLATGPILLGRARREIPLVAASASLFGVTVLIGFFPQSWYQASYMALPAHRFYVFYSLVALIWLLLAAPRLDEWLPPKSIAAAILLAFGQLSLNAFFVLRMLEPRPHLQTVLEASRWVAERSPPEDGVALVLSELDSSVGVARGVLAPRRIVVLEWRDESDLDEARESGARYVISDLDLGKREDLSPMARFDLDAETVRVFRIEP